eukprot:scaffold7480_cov430-Prasinococcus_capsulatus_cf.AAC.1
MPGAAQPGASVAGAWGASGGRRRLKRDFEQTTTMRVSRPRRRFRAHSPFANSHTPGRRRAQELRARRITPNPRKP